MGATGRLFPARGSLTMISALDSHCSTAPPHLAHLVAPLFPPRFTHAPGRGPGAPVLGSLSGGPGRAGENLVICGCRFLPSSAPASAPDPGA